MRGAEFITRRPWPVLGFALIVTFAAGLLAARVSFENAIEIWFLESDPALQTYDTFTGQFSADELVVLAVRTPVFNEETFRLLSELSRRVREAPHVHRVRSVLDFELDPPIPFDEDGVDEVAATASTIDWSERRQAALANSLITPGMVARDAETTALLIEVERSGNTVEGKRALVEALDAIVADSWGTSGIPMQITGTPVLDHRALVLNDRDLSGIYPLIVPFILIVCWTVFASIRLALLPLLVVIAAAVCAFGFMGALGLKTTLLSSAMVPLFLAIGVADSVHMLVDYQQRRVDGLLPRDAARASLTRLWQPCLFTSLTTAAGLCALLASDLRPVREFGLTAAVGVLAAFAMTMTLVPALLTLLGERIPARHPPARSALQRLVTRFVEPAAVISRLALVVALLIAGLSIVSATRIEIGVSPMSWFKANDPFRDATQLVDGQLGGATAVEFLVRAAPDVLTDTASLEILDEFERWLEHETLISGCVSPVELVKEATRSISEGELRVARLPGVPFMTEALLEQLQSRGELERWLSEARDMARISCRVPLGRAADLGTELDRVKEEIDRRFADKPLEVQPTGYGVLMVEMEHHLVRSQLLTVSIAFAVVLMMLALLIRAPALAAIAMLPNLLPVLVGLGLMPLLAISLNPGTVMVAAVALGIVVDDTAHLLVALRRQLDAGHTLMPAMAEAIGDVGAPVILTSLILTGSMALLMLGSFAPGIQFGTIAAVIVLVALLADLWLLPQLLMRMPIARWLNLNLSETEEVATASSNARR